MKKFIVHSFRWLLIAEQLVKNPKLEYLDFNVANDLFYEVMACSSTDWEFYDETYREKRRLLIDRVFPKEILRDDFLDHSDGIPLPVAELKRAILFQLGGSFDSQVKNCVLNIIRKSILTKDQFVEQFPQFVEDYVSVENDFEHLCATIQV